MAQHGVDDQQQPAREEARPDGVLTDGVFLGDAEGLDVEREDGPEVQPREGIHGLVAAQDAFECRQVGIGGGRGAVLRGHRVEQTAREQDEDQCDEGRAEDAAQPVGELFRMECHEERRRKENDGIAQLQTAPAAHQRHQHLERGAGRAGDGEAWPDGEIDQNGEHEGKFRVDPAGQLVEPARSGHGHHACDGQADGADGEPGKGRPEVGTGLCAEMGRKDQISGSEEHRKQRKTEEQALPDGELLHGGGPPFRAGCPMNYFTV